MAEKKQYYTCPMHPEIKNDMPGICPICGMNLIQEETKETEEHKHELDTTQMFFRKFWISAILTVPIVLLNFKIISFPASTYIILLLATFIFFYGGFVFIRGALKEFKAKLPGMMTLIALAVSAAYAFSLYATISAIEPLFWELATLISIMLLGHWLEIRAVSSAQSALKELSKLLPDSAEIIRADKTEIIPLEKLRIGNVVLVRPGAKIPADGKIIEGQSEVNEAMITGESRPVAKFIGNETIAGTINGDGMLKIEVLKIGENTFLAGIMRLVAQAQASKSRLQILADRAAFYLTIIAIAGGTATFILWTLSGAGFSFSITRLVAVLVIACPHALGLAVPLVASISTTLAAKAGFLVRDRLALESARKIDIVLFDKTGTLTKGEFGVSGVLSFSETSENEILRLAASVDVPSEHFISKAILKAAKEKGLVLSEVKNFERLAGKGAKGVVEGKQIFVGNEAILKEIGTALGEEFKSKTDELAQQGKTVVFVVSDSTIIGAISLADIIREESREAINNLKSMGIKTALLTGDNEGAAAYVAKKLGIDEYFAKVFPEEKVEKVKLLQKRGLKTAMVGDGINDAPSLAQSDIGIAIGAGTNVAIESAGIILVRNNPSDVAKIINLSRLTYAKMVQNLFWATGYNIVALPLAAGVLAHRGILLQPALAALFMSLSTVIVAINAMFLRKTKLD